MTSRRMYESTDGITWTEFAAPGAVMAMTVGDDGYVYIGSWFELDAPPEGHSFYRFDGSTFELVDNQTEVEWLTLATFHGEILGAGDHPNACCASPAPAPRTGPSSVSTPQPLAPPST